MAQDQQRYRAIERIDAGGMAEVYRAEALGLQDFRKQVAIKRVLPHLAAKGTFIKMFLDEARLSGRLSHSNCVQVFDVGRGDGTYFIAMEFVDGANLRSIIETMKNNNRNFPVEEAIYIAIELCKGLYYAHNLKDEHGAPLNIVHRDMSPPNVLITKFGEVKIVDFGLAKANTQLEKSEPGIIKGKFSYLAPEAAHGKEVDARADIFAIGIMLWEMLAGRRLFMGKSDLETVQMVQRANVPAISKIRTDVPSKLEPILAKALAQDPERRFRTARDLGVELNAFLHNVAPRPVNDFELSDLVTTAMEWRRREKEKERTGDVDKFLQWANELVFQFQSLRDEKEGDAKPEVLELGLGWGSSQTGSSVRRSIHDLEDLSNLADDHEEGGYDSSSRRASAADRPGLVTPQPMSAPQIQSTPPAQAVVLAPEAPVKGASTTLWLVIIFLMIVIAAGAVYFFVIKHGHI
jgi:serine/threonine-protein kinase